MEEIKIGDTIMIGGERIKLIRIENTNIVYELQGKKKGIIQTYGLTAFRKIIRKMNMILVDKQEG